MVFPGLYIDDSVEKGRGVFTRELIPAGTVIEISPVIVMGSDDRKLLDKTLLHDYIFEWGEKKDQCCMALGYVAVYNHSFNSNCEYEMDFENRQIRIRTVVAVNAGEELFVNYNGDFDDRSPVWFEAK
jgi:SET domain-containing protein